jgi:hypothetical protein
MTLAVSGQGSLAGTDGLGALCVSAGPGLDNPGNQCYKLASLQLLGSAPLLRDSFLRRDAGAITGPLSRRMTWCCIQNRFMSKRMSWCCVRVVCIQSGY